MVRSLAALVAWLLAAYAAALVGGAASIDAGEFYDRLAQPPWAPPAWLFGPVWTVLYALMGTAAWLVWRDRGLGGAAGAFVLFFVQLAANALWTWLFFEWRMGVAAFIEIVLLWGLIVATIVAFGRIRPLAGVLLVPYLLWVSFAAALTYVLWQANPDLLA